MNRTIGRQLSLAVRHFFLNIGSMSREEQNILQLAGEGLYGRRWQSSLARDLGTTDRNLRYWCAGTHAAPSDIYDRLISLLRQRGDQLAATVVLIEKARSQAPDDKKTHRAPVSR